MSPHDAIGGTLNAEEKNWLLRRARAVIAGALGTGAREFEAPPPPRLAKLRTGVFVTLHRKGMLRGCVGMLDTDAPLATLIDNVALSAAFRDTRFPPLRDDELQQCDVEISVLTEPEKISGPDEIEIGRDGVIVEHGGRRGLLLPQVAPEHGWDALMLLEHTCLKAGLRHDTWRSPETQIWRFGAEVFGERE